jgi:hypothetical protein
MAERPGRQPAEHAQEVKRQGDRRALCQNPAYRTPRGARQREWMVVRAITRTTIHHLHPRASRTCCDARFDLGKGSYLIPAPDVVGLPVLRARESLREGPGQIGSRGVATTPGHPMARLGVLCTDKQAANSRRRVTWTEPGRWLAAAWPLSHRSTSPRSRSTSRSPVKPGTPGLRWQHAGRFLNYSPRRRRGRRRNRRRGRAGRPGQRAAEPDRLDVHHGRGRMGRASINYLLTDRRSIAIDWS